MLELLIVLMEILLLPDDNTTYVYEGTEVEKTGRLATKTIKLTSRSFTETMFEIQPVDKTGPTWKRWVKETDLFTVM